MDQKVLKDHMLTHKEHLYKCDVCDKSFPMPSRVNEHYKKTHGRKENESSQLVLCDLCPKSYNNKASLKSHIKRKHRR